MNPVANPQHARIDSSDTSSVVFQLLHPSQPTQSLDVFYTFSLLHNDPTKIAYSIRGNSNNLNIISDNNTSDGPTSDSPPINFCNRCNIPSIMINTLEANGSNLSNLDFSIIDYVKFSYD